MEYDLGGNLHLNQTLVRDKQMENKNSEVVLRCHFCQITREQSKIQVLTGTSPHVPLVGNNRISRSKQVLIDQNALLSNISYSVQDQGQHFLFMM